MVVVVRHGKERRRLGAVLVDVDVDSGAEPEQDGRQYCGARSGLFAA